MTEHAHRITKTPCATEQLSPGAITREGVHFNEDPDAAKEINISKEEMQNLKPQPRPSETELAF